MQRFFKLYRLKAPELALSGTGFLKVDAWTWPELCTMDQEMGLPTFEVPAEEMVDPLPVEDGPPEGDPTSQFGPRFFFGVNALR